MRQTKVIFLASVLLAATVQAGTLSGTISAEGKPGTAAGVAGGNYASRKYKFVRRVDYADMHDFVVYIEGPLGTNAMPLPKPAHLATQRVVQQGARFYPHILPVMVGTTVEWPNKDDILHNVFSFSDTKSFDLGLYKSPQVKSVTFDRPGRVDVFCSIHSQMSCIILVLSNPYFATTDQRGHYTIPEVPAGTYKLKAWHERLPSQVKEVTVPDKGEVKVDFTLGIKNLPQL